MSHARFHGGYALRADDPVDGVSARAARLVLALRSFQLLEDAHRD
jgi:hypothetical protein